MGMKFSHEMKPLLADDFCFYRGASFFCASNHVIIKRIIIKFLLRNLMDVAMWSFEANLAVSLIKAMFATLHTFVNSGIRHA